MTRLWQRRRSWIVPASLLGVGALSTGCGDDNNNGGGGGTFTVARLVANDGTAPVTDAKLVNAWGIARAPQGPWWVANNHSGTSTVYDGNGAPLPAAGPLVVTIPPPAGSPPGAEGAPTGLVFNGTTDFVLTNGMPALFIFDTEDGTFAGWNLDSGTVAEITKDDSDEGAIYKGLAIGKDGSANRLYATDFHNGSVDVYDGEFEDVDRDGAFADPNIPDGYAPFGIQNIGTSIFVTYAKQAEDKEDDVAGGNGFVDVFDGAGNLLKRFASRGQLNAPWGVTQAPARSARSPARSSSATSATAASTRSTPVPARSRASSRRRAAARSRSRACGASSSATARAPAAPIRSTLPPGRTTRTTASSA
jgi:uncharacterized protein (TIGR03118 family)